MEACLPLYGHEFGESPDGKEFPIFAMPMARFAVSFAEEKGDFIGREALAKQFAAFKAINAGDLSTVADLPYRTQAIALIDRGVMRGGMELYRGEEHIGWVTSGTMVPYITETGSANRSLGMAFMKSDVKETADHFELAMDLPGFTKDDVKLMLKDGVLKIEATTKTENDEKDADGKYIRRERFQGTCERSFYVGEDLTEEDIKARFTDGVLKVIVPKKENKPQIEEKKYIAIED
jgi:HSP20 family molecular chaperone IbpA